MFPVNTAERPALLAGRGWEGGERLDLQADGLPGQPSVSMTAPVTRLEVRAPALGGTDPMQLSRTTNLRVEWAPVPNRVSVRLRTMAGGDRRMLSCFFEGTKGVGIVPAAGIERLPVVDGTNVTGTLLISTDVQRNAMEDDWAIFVVATTLHARRAIITATP